MEASCQGRWLVFPSWFYHHDRHSAHVRAELQQSSHPSWDSDHQERSQVLVYYLVLEVRALVTPYALHLLNSCLSALATDMGLCHTKSLMPVKKSMETIWWSVLSQGTSSKKWDRRGTLKLRLPIQWRHMRKNCLKSSSRPFLYKKALIALKVTVLPRCKLILQRPTMQILLKRSVELGVQILFPFSQKFCKRVFFDNYLFRKCPANSSRANIGLSKLVLNDVFQTQQLAGPSTHIIYCLFFEIIKSQNWIKDIYDIPAIC